MDNGLGREYWDIQRELDASLPVQYRMAFVAEQQELEADREGFFLGAQAGFDPAAMISLLAKLGPAPSTPASTTHPSLRKRLDQAAAMRHSATQLYLRTLPPV
jgi:predicted Zn-dependent protease